MTWQEDAELAGTLYRKSKVYTAMLIARCVEPKQGARTDLRNSPKVPASTFAKHSDITDKTVTAYLKAWDAMATAGLVPSRDELTPGTDVDLPDTKQWKYYYGEANGTKKVAEKEAPKTLPKPEEVPEDELGEPVDIEPTRIVGRYVVRMSQSVKSSKIDGPARDALNRVSSALSDFVAGDDPR